jgi:hypothetical protein
VAPREQNPKFPSFWQAVGILVVTVFLEIAIAIFLLGAGLDLYSGDPRSYVIIVLATGIVLSCVLAYKKLGYRQLFDPANRPFEAVVPPIAGPLVLYCLGAFVLSWEFDNLAARFVPVSESTQEDLASLMTRGLPSIVTTCVLAPVVEEMMFRGVFLRGFLYRYPAWMAIGLSSFIFGLAHIDPGHAIVAGTMGVAFGWLYYATRSLWPSIIAHAVMNTGALVYTQLDPDSWYVADEGAILMLPLPVLLIAGLALYHGAKQIAAATRRADAGEAA